MMRAPYPVGEIRITEVLELYDEPVLYFGANTTDQNFLVMLSRDEADAREWLLVPLSNARLSALRALTVDLYDAFVRVEGGFVWRARQTRNGHNEMSLHPVNAANLSDAELPERGQRAEPLTRALANKLPDAKQRAIACQRDVVFLHLYPRNPDQHEVPLMALSRAVSGIQGLVFAIEAHRTGNATKRGQFPKQTTQSAGLVAAATHAASFAVELRSAQIANPFGETTISSTIDSLFSLLDTLPTPDALAAALPQFASTRVATRLRELLTCLEDGMPAVELVWGSPAATRPLRRAHFDRACATSALRVIGTIETIAPSEFDAYGHLEAADATTHVFKFFDERSGMVHIGRASDAALLIGAVIRRQTYIARIRRTQELEPSGDLRIRHELLELTCVEPSEMGDDIF